MVQGQLRERRVLGDGRHEWRVDLPQPFSSKELWLDTQTLHAYFDQARRVSAISAPARSTPELVPFQGFTPLVNNMTGWTCHHALVGTVVTIHTPPSFNQTTTGGSPTGSSTGAKKLPKVLENVTIEAAYVPLSHQGASDSNCQFWGRLHSDLSLSVIFPDLGTVVAASHYNDVERYSKRNNGGGSWMSL